MSQHTSSRVGNTTWQRRLALTVAVHDLIVSGDKLLGRISPEYEPARQAVADIIDETIANGVAVETIDAELARLRTER